MLENKCEHGFSVRDRQEIRIDGVSDVISFDEVGVALETVCGSMAIEGEGLHITVLNVSEGKVEISGRVNGVYYYEKNTVKRGLFGRKNV